MTEHEVTSPCGRLSIDDEPRFRLNFMVDPPISMAMRWRKRKEEARADEDATHEDRTLSRLRGIAETEHPSLEHDPKDVEARIRNMNYGTNRE